MRRVVVTGMGVVSSIGADTKEVLESLRTGRSGLAYQPEYEEMGLRIRIGRITDIADGQKALAGWVLAAGCGGMGDEFVPERPASRRRAPVSAEFSC